MNLTQAFATGTRPARQGVPLLEVQRAFRIGFSALWEVLLDVVAVAGEHERQVLANLATSFWYLIDRFLEAVSNAYRQATAELVRAQRHRRVALLDALLSGGVVTDSTRWDITQLLDLPHDGALLSSSPRSVIPPIARASASSARSTQYTWARPGELLLPTNSA